MRLTWSQDEVNMNTSVIYFMLYIAEEDIVEEDIVK